MLLEWRHRQKSIIIIMSIFGVLIYERRDRASELAICVAASYRISK